MANNNTSELDRLTDLYHNFEQKISVLPVSADESLKSLVTFDDSKTSPIHRWYPFKEGYSPKLISTLHKKGILPNKRNGLRLLDPFCGFGTTLLSSQLIQEPISVTTAIGVERNPAIFFIANAKLNWHKYRTRIIKALLEKLKLPHRGRRHHYSVPQLSTFSVVRPNGKRAFYEKQLQDLLFYREWITSTCFGEPEFDFFMLAWTAIVGRASNTRKDGRALRLLNVSDSPNVKELLIEQCELMLEDISVLKRKVRKVETLTQVTLGDGRSLPFKSSSFSALCYSPPYLNNIDYSEVYKLELWLRGDITNQQQFQSLRLSTFRSHPSITFPKTSICDNLPSTTWIRRLKSGLLNSLPKDRYQVMRESLLSGYIDDTIKALKEQYRVVAPRSPIICIVGNSLHGGKANPTVPVCTDLLIAAAAQAVGLGIDHLQIARQLPRRDNKNGWLRETIIVMQKPQKSADKYG